MTPGQTSVDDFAPVKINLDVDALVPDPDDPERGLLVHDGSPVIYPCRIDLVAVDAADEYWVVCHQIVDEWQDIDTLVRDEEAVASCWAFEHDYIGIQIAGTIHNEVRVAGPLKFPPAGSAMKRLPKAVAQHEASGGGRSLPQHQRVSAQASRRTCDRPDRAAHRGRTASYSHPSQPPRDRLRWGHRSLPRRST